MTALTWWSAVRLGITAACLICGSVGTAVSATPPAPYDVGWDDTIGLWNHNTNQSLHQIRANAWKLVAAGMDGMLDQVPTLRVLNNLRTAQSTTGSRGNFWWDWEDGTITDPNGGFFTGLGLLTLRLEFAAQLTPEQLAVLDTMLDELQIYMTGQTASLTEGYLKYPNMALGEVTCHWLLLELHGGVTPYYQGRMTTALSYYRDNNWGWGEHLSDLYVKICQEELLALLLYGNGLSASNRDLAQTLFGELATIDATFSGGPRVPTIRCYEMDVSPRTPDAWNGIYKPYLDAMVPWAGQYGATGYQILSVLGYQHGLHVGLPAGPLPGRTFTTDCHGGAQALSIVDPRWRLGVMSRYPLAVDSNQKTSGLHWQSMPAAFWHAAGDWGYLQWVARENNKPRALPAFSRDEVLSCILSDDDPAAAVGETFGLRKDDSFLILRRLPKIAAGWPWVKDRLRVLSCTATPWTDTTNGWQRLVLPYGQETLTVAYRPVEGEAVLSIQPGAVAELLWEARFDLPQAGHTRLAMVWYLAVGATPAVPPAFTGAGENATLTFPDGVQAELTSWHATTPWTLMPAGPPPQADPPARNWRLRIGFAGYSKPDTLVNFPALVRLGPTTVAGFDYGQFRSANAAGETNADLRFTDVNGLDLNYEVERWDPAGESLVWVRVPALATNTDAIYAHWGRSGVAAPPCTTNGTTWWNGFAGVWHLKETGGAPMDSTTNRFNGILRNGTAATRGMVAGGQQFDGTNDYIEVADKDALSFGNGSADFPFSVGAWIKPDADASGFRIVTKANSTSSSVPPPPEWRFLVNTSGALSFSCHDASTGVDDRLTRTSMNGAVPNGVWSYIYATYDGSLNADGIVLFRNGVPLESTGATGSKYGGMNNTDSTVDMGADLRANNTYKGFADGSADEVRIDRVALSPAWVWASHTNQLAGSGFLTYGHLTLNAGGTLVIIK